MAWRVTEGSYIKPEALIEASTVELIWQNIVDLWNYCFGDFSVQMMEALSSLFVWSFGAFVILFCLWYIRSSLRHSREVEYSRSI